MTTTTKTFILILLLPLTMLLGGCGAERDQAAAEAIAGAETLAQWAPAEIAQQVLDGVRYYVLATRGLESLADLPRAQWTPSAIEQDPEAYRADGAEARDAQAGGTWAWLAAAALTVLGLGGVLIRQSGLGGPLVNMSIGLVSTLLETKAPRTIRKKQGELAQIGVIAVRAIESVDSKPVKQAIDRVVTDEQRRVIDAYLAAEAAKMGHA